MRLPMSLLAAATMLCAAASPIAAQCSTFANSPPGSDLQLGDDEVITVGLQFPFVFDNQSYTTISICSNGYVWLGSVTADAFGLRGADWFDNVNDFLDFGPRIAVCWDDWNPDAGGGVYYRPEATYASVVWKNVPRFGGIGQLNAELVLTATGDFWIDWDITSVASSDMSLVGTSAGGGAPPNPVDWSTAVNTVIPGCTGHEVFGPGGFDLAGVIHRHAPTTPAAIDHTVLAGTLSTCPPGNYPPLATTPLAFGVGCPTFTITSPNAIYEAFTPTSSNHPTDLSGLSIEFVKNGTTYTTTTGPGFDTSYLTQGTVVPQFDETIATGLPVGPMGVFPFSTGGFAFVDAAANGYVLLQAGGSSDFSPTAAEFLAGLARIAPHWSDYDFTFAGTFYWSNNDANFCMATWENVEMYAQPGTSNTFQVKLRSNGNIVFSYGNVASAFDDVLAGITLGNGATNPGASDLSDSGNNPVVRDLGTIMLPLEHTASGPASINTVLNLWADNLNGGVVGAFVVGQPISIDLSPFGAPGCSSYVTIDDIYFAFASNGRLTLTFAVPPSPPLFGLVVHTQAAVLTPVNPFGIIASNRLTFTIGL